LSAPSAQHPESNVHDNFRADVVGSIRCAVVGLCGIKDDAISKHSLEFGERLKRHSMRAVKLSSMLQLCQVVAPVESLVLPFEVPGLDGQNANSSKCNNKLLFLVHFLLHFFVATVLQHALQLGAAAAVVVAHDAEILVAMDVHWITMVVAHCSAMNRALKQQKVVVDDDDLQGGWFDFNTHFRVA